MKKIKKQVKIKTWPKQLIEKNTCHLDISLL